MKTSFSFSGFKIPAATLLFALFFSTAAFARGGGGHFGDIRGEILDKPFREDQQTQRKEQQEREKTLRKVTRSPGQVDGDSNN